MEAESLTRFQRFTMERVNRADIKGAPYNPRAITPYARKNLQAFIKKMGLLAPVTVNKRTMMLVGGHQRLDILDALEGKIEYALDVAMVDLDAKSEREANLGLNNPAMQGEFDRDKLEELFKEGVNFETAGFGKLDLEVLGIGDMFRPETQSPQIASDMAEMQQIAETRKPVQTAKERRAEMKAEHKTNENVDAETYLVVVCGHREHCEQLAAAMGAPSDSKYIDGSKLAQLLNVTLTEVTR